MGKTNYKSWNQIVYYVADIYRITRYFRPGAQSELSEKIRRTAIELSVMANDFAVSDKNITVRDMNSLFSAMSVLETYLFLAQKSKFIRDSSFFDDKLQNLRFALKKLLMADGFNESNCE